MPMLSFGLRLRGAQMKADVAPVQPTGYMASWLRRLDHHVVESLRGARCADALGARIRDRRRRLQQQARLDGAAVVVGALVMLVLRNWSSRKMLAPWIPPSAGASARRALAVGFE